MRERRMHNSANQPLAYMPQLDGLRAFAVSGVLLSHYVAQDWITGHMGVRLFFVLSGFLITRILLNSRVMIEAGETTSQQQIKMFYTRRALRLYPALALLILVLVILNFGDLRVTWPWHLMYLSNVYFGIHGVWSLPTSILWTVSVEEQFYLVWPLVIILSPRRYLSRICITAVIAGVAWKVGAMALDNDTLWAHVAPFGALDTLGMGALTAIALDRSQPSVISSERLRLIGRGPALWALVIVVALSVLAHADRLFFMFFDVTAAFVFGWVIAAASRGMKGSIGRILEARAIVYIGKISYGVYLCHAFSPFVVTWVMRVIGVQRSSPVVLFCLFVATTVAIASLSWLLWERPIRSLRNRFAYRPSQTMNYRNGEVVSLA